MGAARGIDEGLIGTTAELEPFKKKFGLEDPNKSKHEKAELLSNITSMVQMGSILGALLAFTVTDKIGKLFTMSTCFSWFLIFAFRQAVGYETIMSHLGCWDLYFPCERKDRQCWNDLCWPIHCWYRYVRLGNQRGCFSLPRKHFRVPKNPDFRAVH